MNDKDGQPLAPEHYALMSNAGRCDICGRPIDMDGGDRLIVVEDPTLDADIKDEHGISDQDVRDGIADALESVGESGADYDLAHTIRDQGAFKAHKRCFEATNYSMLEADMGEFDD